MGSQTQLIAICGVSGSGKSTIAKELATRHALHFLDADDFHTREARQRMSEGLPLTEEMRVPWLAAISVRLQELARAQAPCVIAFPGLCRTHRQVLRETGFSPAFFLLCTSATVIRKRIEQRSGHFMPTSLLESQMMILEPPEDEPDVHIIDGSLNRDVIVSQIKHLLKWD